jgi:hypothetical protein
MSQDNITCPNCSHSFALTAAMSSSIEAALKSKYETQVQARVREINEAAAARDAQAQAKERDLEAQRKSLEAEAAASRERNNTIIEQERVKITREAQAKAQEDAKLKVTSLETKMLTLEREAGVRERAAIEAQEAARVKQRELEERERNITLDVEAKVRSQRGEIEKRALEQATARAAELSAAEREAMQLQLQSAQEKISKSQQAELEMRRRAAALEEEKRDFELQKQRELDAERAAIAEKAYNRASDEQRLKVAEKDKLIADLTRQSDEMKRKLEQGSQQLQGEVQELDLEATLRTAFPRDTIEPVPKGTFGGDAIHRVSAPMGVQLTGNGGTVGTILWESKRTKNWSDLWLAKLRGDQREAKADVCVIVTSVLPKGISSFGQMEGVWVCDLAAAVPLACVLRHALVEISTARQSTLGKQGKMELVYHYLTGPSFRQRVDAIREAFESMREDLETEKKVITKQWAKRAKQIEMVVDNTVGLYGDLQGIAGSAMPEIEGLEMKGLPG